MSHSNARRFTRYVWAPLLCFALTLVGVSSLAAQNTITLEGTVTGKDAGPLAGATVTARNVATNETRTTTTKQDGNYRFLGLFSGQYEVSARAIGYSPAKEVVQLVVGQRASVALTLYKGAAELASVNVVAEKVKSVEVQRMSVSAAVLKQEIENLPLNSRGVMNLAAVAPGVKAYAPQSGRTLPSAGAAPDLRFINLYMDGVEMKSLFNGNLVGIPQTGSPLPQEALEEFRIYTTPYDAEYSRAGSYVISAVSQRGTNTWQGSAFGFFQNQDFIHRTFIQEQLNQRLPDYGRQQAGFNLRGPLKRDRLFLATSYEVTNTNNYIDVNPTNRTQWAQYAGSFKAPNLNHTGYLRSTWVPNDRSTIDGMYSLRYMKGESNYGATVARDGGISQSYWIQTGQLRHRYLAASGFENEASAQLVSWYHYEAPLAPGPQRNYPSITLGTSGFPLELRETHYRLVDRATFAKDNFFGDHIFKIGGEAEYVNASDFNPTNANGTFTFATDQSTLPTTASISVGFTDKTGTSDAKATAGGTILGTYVNDEWRPISNLTLNLGLRYDAELNTLDNKFFSPWAQDSRLWTIRSLEHYLNRANRRNDLNNLSPRLSFSWDPFKTNRTFVRGGFAIMYDRVTSFMGFAEKLNGTWRTYSFNNPGTADPNVLRQRVIAGGVNVTPALTLVKDKMETPENHQISVGVGHQLNDELGINVDYVRQRMSHLYVRSNPNWFDTQARTRQLTNAYGDFTVYDDFGKAAFDGIVSQFTFQRRTTRVNLAYTLGWYRSTFEGNISNVFPLTTSFRMQPTSGDERHRFVLSEVTKIPFGFTLSSITTLASPRPIAAIDGRDLNHDNTTSDDFLHGGWRTVRPPEAFNQWYRTIDVRLARDVVDFGSRKLTLSAEVFNLLNWSNVQGYNSRAFDQAGNPIPQFTSANAAFAARQVQVGAKVAF
jgi:carboxypeptidase family protein